MPLRVHAISRSASAPTAQHQRRGPRTAGDHAGKQNCRFIGALVDAFATSTTCFCTSSHCMPDRSRGRRNDGGHGHHPLVTNAASLTAQAMVLGGRHGPRAASGSGRLGRRVTGRNCGRHRRGHHERSATRVTALADELLGEHRRQGKSVRQVDAKRQNAPVNGAVIRRK
jgi:hypothetical protein